ncbi:unnamed protein product [Macrosiphum euphorbiae]|uniref:Uncharacterized protein n=2 Tax=Macrosiphum euphorbiae TaxID=13131 RepID=A0AAV0WI35_9HEMI|nr:unnamed protein product [Macrosiphum euphorbiae]
MFKIKSKLFKNLIKITNIMKRESKNINFKSIFTDEQKSRNPETRKKIKNSQININRIQQGKEAYNRSKIRRTRKHEPQQQVIKKQNSRDNSNRGRNKKEI